MLAGIIAQGSYSSPEPIERVRFDVLASRILATQRLGGPELARRTERKGVGLRIHTDERPAQIELLLEPRVVMPHYGSARLGRA